MSQRVKTPCIGVCSTGLGDSVCRGCKRFSHEVIRWVGYSDREQEAILARIDSLLCRVIEQRVRVFDQQCLKKQLMVQNVRFDPALSPHTWVHQLLKAGANQIENLEDYGCKVMGQWAHLSLPELKQTIDQDFYSISCSHYERYFKEFV